jgi:hypothetical protein
MLSFKRRFIMRGQVCDEFVYILNEQSALGLLSSILKYMVYIICMLVKVYRY